MKFSRLLRNLSSCSLPIAITIVYLSVPPCFGAGPDEGTRIQAAVTRPPKPPRIPQNVAIGLSGYFGTSTQNAITGIALDGSNNILVTGWVARTGAGPDAFVASFRPNGGNPVYCVYLGGTGDDRAQAIAVDAAGNAYVTGYTQSTGFPVVNAAQARLSGVRDAFVAKVSPTGQLVYSTFLGGSGSESGTAIVVTSASLAIVVGDTTSSNFPVASSGFQPVNHGAQDGFIAVLAASGNVVSSASYFGGAAADHLSAIRQGPGGPVYVAGYTWSADFPTKSASQPSGGGGQDGFVAKISLDCKTLYWSTYLGGRGGSAGFPEQVTSIALDAQGNIYAAGTTSSANFPGVSRGYQRQISGPQDGFIAHVSRAGQLLGATYLGGSSTDEINAIALDSYGYAYATGFTSSQDFPVRQAVQSADDGALNAFVAKLAPDYPRSTLRLIWEDQAAMRETPSLLITRPQCLSLARRPPEISQR